MSDGVAVVTGGASGIGLAFARAYAERGAHIVIGDIDEAAMAHARVGLAEKVPPSTVCGWICRMRRRWHTWARLRQGSDRWSRCA